MSKTTDLDLVRPDDFGVKSEHYYFVNRDRFDLTIEELAQVGVSDDKCRVGTVVIPTLLEAQSKFRALGYDLIIKDGYRSPALYRLVYDKRIARYGEEHTHKLLNIDRMIHAKGNVVDIDLAPLDGSKMMFRSGEDGIPAHIYGFYQDRPGTDAIIFQRNQDMMKEIMFGLGYEFGTLVEYWHFELVDAS